MTLLVNQNYQFTLSYQGAVSYINYQVDFGDGTKTGWFSGTVNGLTNVSHVFAKTGKFAVSVAARSVAGMNVREKSQLFRMLFARSSPVIVQTSRLFF